MDAPMKYPTAKQVSTWLSRVELVMRLEGGKVLEERLFTCLGIDEEHKEWARAFLWEEIQHNTEYSVFDAGAKGWYYEKVNPQKLPKNKMARIKGFRNFYP